MRAVGYVRVSTREQADSGLGLGAQRRAISDACKARGWRLAKVFEDAGASGKTTNGRPGLADALATCDDGKADVLVVAKLDRLSRSLLDFTAVMQRGREKGWRLVVLDLGVDTTTATGAMVANIMAALAEWERQMIGERTRAALAEKAAEGARLGRPSAISPELRKRIYSEHLAGDSLGAIARRLNAEGVPTVKQGARWYPSTIRRVVVAEQGGE